MKERFFKCDSSSPSTGRRFAAIIGKSLHGTLPTLILSCVFVLILSACSQQEAESLMSESTTYSVTDYSISPEEAVKNAEKYFAALEDGTRAKSRSSYTLSVVKSDRTRSAENGNTLPDSLYYLINYSDDNGFALMSADKRLPELMAISEDGNLDLNDTIYNKGLASYMAAIGNPTIPNYTFPPVIIDNPVIKAKPMLSASVSKWSQGAPYNKYCPVKNGTNINYKTGSLALSVGQIMSYYKHPASYNSYTFNWSDMVSGNDNDGVAKLLSYIGNSSNLAVNYVEDYTDVARLMVVFPHFGYSFSYIWSNLNDDFPHSILAGGVQADSHPVITYGIDRISDVIQIYHYWVLDGKMTVKSTTADGGSYDKIYIHCVWGLGGKGNGYFFYNFDNVIGGNADKLADNDSSEAYTLPRYKIEWYWKDFQPKK